LSTVRTIPEYRNQGVGGALMEVIKNWSKEQNLEALLVGPSERSIPFYERSGFKHETDIMEMLFE
jgi:GNAT superfamily N-acetyltransferase